MILKKVNKIICRNSTGWSGMVGMVVRGESDLSMSEFTISAQRRTAVDFSVPLMADSVHLVMGKPGLNLFSFYKKVYGICFFQGQTTDWELYLSGFSYSFWVALLAAGAVVYAAFLAYRYAKSEYFFKKRLYGRWVVRYFTSGIHKFQIQASPPPRPPCWRSPPRSRARATT